MGKPRRAGDLLGAAPVDAEGEDAHAGLRRPAAVLPELSAGRGGGGRRRRLRRYDLARLDRAALRRDGIAPQYRVHGLGHFFVDRDLAPALDLDEHVEGGRGLAFEDALLRPAAAGLLVAQGDRLDAADEVGERGVQDQVFQRVAVRRRDELDAALSDGAGRLRLELAPDLVDDDHLRHVVLHRLDHHLVLQRGGGHLHAAGASDAVVRDVAVARDLVRRVDDHDTLAVLVGEDARHLAQHRRLAHAGPPQQEHAAPRLGQVVDDLDRAEHRPPDARGQPDDLAFAVADRRDAVQRPLDARAVVLPKVPDALRHQLERPPR